MKHSLTNHCARWLAMTSMLALGLAACGGGGGGYSVSAPTPTIVTPSTGSGSLRMALTDAPACGFDAVNVTVSSLRVHMNANAADSDAGWASIALATPRRLNLLNLTNGVLEELGQTPLPVGKYTQLRLVLAENDSANPLANSVVPTGGAETALKTPSGQQSGVKANIDIDIAANQMADFVLDFNACKSIVTAGNSGQYLLKPVVTVVPRLVTGVSGFVSIDLANGSTTVSLQQGGVVVKATAPDATGRFLLQPVPAGNYTFVLSATGRTTQAITSVPVAAGTVTAINLSANALTTTASASATIQGNAPVNTQVRVLQTLSLSGNTVELAGQFVNGTTGNYSYTVPVNAPMVAAYAVAPTALVFVADLTVAGRYSAQASLSGFLDKTNVLPTLVAGTTTTSNFLFP